MAKKTIFLTLEQILAIHDNQIESYGGSHGIHNLPLLESAVTRPQTIFAGQDMYKSIFDKAAALMHSLVLNHPFLDGNKRTATVSMLVFLELNGYRLKVEQEELIQAALKTSKKKLNKDDLSTWLKTHSAPTTS